MTKYKDLKWRGYNWNAIGDFTIELSNGMLINSEDRSVSVLDPEDDTFLNLWEMWGNECENAGMICENEEDSFHWPGEPDRKDLGTEWHGIDELPIWLRLVVSERYVRNLENSL